MSKFKKGDLVEWKIFLGTLGIVLEVGTLKDMTQPGQSYILKDEDRLVANVYTSLLRTPVRAVFLSDLTLIRSA